MSSNENENVSEGFNVTVIFQYETEPYFPPGNIENGILFVAPEIKLDHQRQNITSAQELNDRLAQLGPYMAMHASRQKQNGLT